MVHFPVSGVEVNPLIPLLAAFAVSALTAPAGVSGAFLLLPFQVSVLGFDSLAVSPTNLVYNIFAAPGGVYRYVREGRVVWPLAWAVILDTLPGAFVGALLRITVLTDPRAFVVFVGLVLLYFGVRLLYGILVRSRSCAGEGTGAGHSTVRIVSSTPLQVEYEYDGKPYAYRHPDRLRTLARRRRDRRHLQHWGRLDHRTVPRHRLRSAGLHGCGSHADRDVRHVGGEGRLLRAARGHGLRRGHPIASDWLLGLTLGLGGLAGTYAGARLQRHVPERLIRGALGVLVTLLALKYIL
jgi:uncharacterized membrane protein YfcA